jgi:hypothetical protein|tara:strand:- start:456 stop:740 length:285 start_codon:yes stop_codon:yes gene_type:complete
MKKHKYSDYENYILTADKCGLRLGYESFLDFKVIVSFIKEIASKTGDTFLHNGTIYSKKITSEAASKFLDNLTRNRCDVFTLKLVGNQLMIRVK